MLHDTCGVTTTFEPGGSIIVSGRVNNTRGATSYGSIAVLSAEEIVRFSSLQTPNRADHIYVVASLVLIVCNRAFNVCMCL